MKLKTTEKPYGAIGAQLDQALRRRVPLLAVMLAVLVSFSGASQPTRFFEFTTVCGHGNWQDTSFIAATSDQVVIDSVLANLERPILQRNFINGPIDYGNGGCNHNADHWFLWHFIPDQWNLVALAIEVCDGCPYSDVDADTAYWVGTIGQYCPWSGRPVREVQDPSVGIKGREESSRPAFFPNPANTVVQLQWTGADSAEVCIYDALGQEVYRNHLIGTSAMLDISGFSSGLYIVHIAAGARSATERLLKE